MDASIVHQMKRELRLFEIEGEIKKIKLLGSGAICVAYEAQLPTGDVCAAKTPEDGVPNPEFLSECWILSQLRHPNIVSFIGVHGLDTHTPMLLVELMECRLSEYLLCRSSLSVEGILTVLVDVACAMDHLHTRSPPIEHGDITPINIHLLFGRLRAKLSCFNSAEIKTDPPKFIYDIPQFGRVMNLAALEATTIEHKHRHVRVELTDPLKSLAAACINKEVFNRPSARIIMGHLQELLCEDITISSP